MEEIKEFIDENYFSLTIDCKRELNEIYKAIEDYAKTKQLTLTDVVNCNCDEGKQLEEGFEIKHLINDTYQVVGKDSNTVWKQGTMEECNEWVML